MKKLIKVVALLLAVLLAASGCAVMQKVGIGVKEPEPTEEATVAPTPAPTPTVAPYTPEPTVTPRTLAVDVEMPEGGATPLLIDPIDKPTRPPLNFNFVEYVSQQLGISFEIPATWIASSIEGNSNALVFTEPDSEAHDGFASSVTIVVNTYSSGQTLSDAQTELDSVISQIRASYPQLETSSKAENQMLSEKGTYVTYWIDMPLSETASVRTRGRVLVVPKNKKLYQIRYICPAEYNSDYENVFKKIRSSIAEL